MKTLLFVSAAALLAIVAVLPPSTDAKVFTKCELASQLKAKMPQMGPGGIKKMQEILAKVICKVETTTGFNTRAVNPAGLPPFNPAGPPPSRPAGLPKILSDKNHSKMPGFGNLLGIFQLPSQLVCNNKMSLCKLDCSKLIDDDITDDIACMNKIVFQFKGKGPGPQFGEECSGIDASSYLSECNLSPAV
ncbi:lysozyme C-like [Acipenser oxyrinchus oxyrinchus]|uniref:Lysozyme C-like n=1 Tax=Acipenser oxyrinchus oxyrinchus TaxID=40147 RepID=A0AAD8GAX7_ACIOX|nr:lysozyme C-like [Acipenser oxyrinchus oxyrinchus]